MAVGAVEVDEVDGGRGMDGNSLLLTDDLERAVDVREMHEREIANEGAIDFVVTHAAVQPAEEEYELCAGGGYGGEQG